MNKTSRTQLTTPKPNNVFHIWYIELCRRSKTNPIAIQKNAKRKQGTVLDFSADRLKFEDWNPLIRALHNDTTLHVINIKNGKVKYEFQHEADTEEKARGVKHIHGYIWTDFVLISLVKALSNVMKNSQVLTCLELNGLPLFGRYLNEFLNALKENRTIKKISLANCKIQDDGCRKVCTSLRPNVEILDLSGCSLTSMSGKYLAKLIRYQQLNRYTTSWHTSLRYSDPDEVRLAGIRRITLNSNPRIGDQGLEYMLEDLQDDLWIKALDMQKCGITETIAGKLLEMLEYNKSLQVADFRHNDLYALTLEKIMDILSDKTTCSDAPSTFRWCNSIITVNTSTSLSSAGNSKSRTKSQTTIKRSNTVMNLKKISKDSS